MSQLSAPMPLKAIILATLLCVIFGLNAVAVKHSFTGMGVFTTAGLRFLMSATILIVWAKLTGRSLSINRRYGPMILLTLVFIIQLALFMNGLQYTDASRAALIINLQPFVVMVLAHFFLHNDRITTRKSLGITLGFLGMIMLAGGPALMGQRPQLGDYLSLAATILWGMGTVYMKTVIHHYRPFHLVLYPMIAAAPIYLLAGFFFEQPMITRFSPDIIASLLFQGVIVASIGFVLWTSLLQQYGASALNSFLFVNPVVGVISSWYFLGDHLDTSVFISLFLVVTGLMVINIRVKRNDWYSLRGSGS